MCFDILILSTIEVLIRLKEKKLFLCISLYNREITHYYTYTCICRCSPDIEWNTRSESWKYSFVSYVVCETFFRTGMTLYVHALCLTMDDSATNRPYEIWVLGRPSFLSSNCCTRAGRRPWLGTLYIFPLRFFRTFHGTLWPISFQINEHTNEIIRSVLFLQCSVFDAVTVGHR